MKKIKWFGLFIATLMVLPLVASADCPHDFVDSALSAGNFTISKDVGAIFYFSLEELVSPHTEINSQSFRLYLVGGNNISEVSEFIIYPIDTQDKQLVYDEVVINTKTEIENHVELSLPVEKFDASHGDLGFIICTSENSEFVFANSTYEGTDKVPVLILESQEAVVGHIEGTNAKIAEYINFAKKEKEEWQIALGEFSKRLEIAEQQRKEDFRNLKEGIKKYFYGILISFLGSAALAFVVWLWRKRRKKKNVS